MLCSVSGDAYVSYKQIEYKKLGKDEFLEFDVNLADLSWSDVTSSYRNSNKNLKTIPKTFRWFFVEVSLFDKYVELDKSPSKDSTYKNFQSNVISIAFK